MSRARAARRPMIGDLVATARVRFARVPARKARYLADLIRGLTAGEAMVVLQRVHRPSACPLMINLLKSALANAEQKRREDQWDGDPEQLVVGEITVDGGPMLKRYMAAPMGRAVPVRKRMAHATIKLYEAA